MTNVKVQVERLYAATAAGNDGKKIGFINSATKAAQNDTITVVNASEVVWAGLTIDADGSDEQAVPTTNVIALGDATTGAVSGMIIYK